jgi:hypothetical protein
VKALIHSARQAGVEPLLLAATQQRNDAQRRVLGERIVAHYGGQLRGKTIAVWGLAFKPDTDDMREAPSRTLLASWAAGARVQAHDPAAMGEARRLWGERADLRLCDTPAAALRGADALAIVTEWKAYRVPDLALLAAELADRMVFDGATCTSRPCWRATAWATPASAGRRAAAGPGLNRRPGWQTPILTTKQPSGPCLICVNSYQNNRHREAAAHRVTSALGPDARAPARDRQPKAGRPHSTPSRSETQEFSRMSTPSTIIYTLTDEAPRWPRPRCCPSCAPSPGGRDRRADQRHLGGRAHPGAVPER